MNTSWKAATLVVLVLAIWMLSGLFRSDTASTDEQLSSEEPAAFAVAVSTSQSAMMSREISMQGQLAPVREVTVRAQTNGVVENIVTSKGARVATGEPLVKLDQAGRSNSLAEAQAAVKTARSEQEAAQSLRRQRLQSEMQLQQAEAVLESALAALANVELDISYTTINAPFAGVVNSLPIELGALIERGDAIAHIVDDSSFKASASVSQQSLSQLSIGQNVSVSLITGEQLNGTVTFISSIADPTTRSFAIEALIDNPSDTVASGISATLAIPVEEVEATFVTPSSMSLGSDGELGIKAVDADNIVVFMPIELVSTTVDGAWVTGIPNNTRIITLGQGFVNTGEQVNVQDDEVS